MTIEMRADALNKVREMVKDMDFCMLTTVDEEGNLRSRPMSLNREVDANGDLWFFTYASTHKVEEIGRVPQVNASFANPDDQRYVSVSGTAELIRDRQKIEQLWQPQLKAWFPKGVDEPDIALLRVKVTQAEYWDSPASKVSQAISFVSSLVTGEPAQTGEHGKVDF